MSFTATATLTIAATPGVVWQTLTDPEKIKQFMFGSEVTSDWQKGSPITYRGVWNGQTFEDKGTILDVEPAKLLRTDYWSRAFGPAEKPENHRFVSYKLEPVDEGQGTQLTVTQENCASADEVNHSQQTWLQMLNGLKMLAEAGQ
jgi:uncharacterized protein YndB with AHSA1/START domain